MMNVTGKIVINANDYLTNLDKASRQKIKGLETIKNNLAKIKGVQVKMSKKDLTTFKKHGEDVNKICREAVEETGRYCRGEVYRLAYVAPAPYYRVWDNGKCGAWFQPRTLAKMSYSYLIPKKESPKNTHIVKISFYNNKETGEFGEVAVLWEYGSARTPAKPMMRPALELSKKIFTNSIKWRLSKLNT